MSAPVEFHFEKQIGKIKPMHAVNNGPVADGMIPGVESNARYFTEAGFPFVRNHDAAHCRVYEEATDDPAFFQFRHLSEEERKKRREYAENHPTTLVDIHRLFPDFGADENDPASYDFKATDAHTALTVSTGCRVFYRLGAAIEHGKKCGTIPPKDNAKWARICEHVIRHYNEGWADGYRFGIEYWEVWNEPDCVPCWGGSLDEFIELFDVAVKHLKKAFPHLKIGGPAMCWLPNDVVREKFYPAVRDRQIPIDFFSFHCYCTTPQEFVDTINDADRLCREHGFGDVELILDEYNYMQDFNIPDLARKSYIIERNEVGAAFVTSCMLAAQDSPVDMLMYYDARPCGMCGLFTLDTLKPMWLWYCMKMFNRLYQLGGEIEITGLPADVWAVGARDGGHAAVQLCYYTNDENAAEKTVSIRATGLDGGPVRVTCVDRDHYGEEIAVDLRDLTLKPNTVLLIEYGKEG